MKPMIYLLTGFSALVGLVLFTVYLLQDRLIFFPEILPRGHKFEFNSPAEEVFLPSAGNAEFHSLYFTTDNAKGTVLYFHGNAGSLRSWGFVAGDFLSLGYNVFMPDYRGYGKSTGKVSEEFLHHDAQVALHYLKEKDPELPVVIYGRSLGSGLAVKLAADHTPKALILESPFNNLVEVAKAHFPYLPASLLLRYSFRSDKYIQRVKCPVYIIHGTADEVIPHQSAQKLAAAAGSNCTFVSIKGGTHNNLQSSPEYLQLMNEALK